MYVDQNLLGEDWNFEMSVHKGVVILVYFNGW